MGAVAPDMAVDLTVAIQLKAWFTTTGPVQLTLVAVDCNEPVTMINAVLLLPEWEVSPG